MRTAPVSTLRSVPAGARPLKSHTTGQGATTHQISDRLELRCCVTPELKREHLSHDHASQTAEV